MCKLVCEHPTIIKNPVQRFRLDSSWKLFFHDKPIGFVPSVKRTIRKDDGNTVVVEITEDDLEHCYYLNVETGETIPMYILVPCGKCLLCRNKKAKAWATRCICETMSHDEQPYFVTLTYNDTNLPLSGLDKQEVQRFFKRLRIRFERKGFSCYIRYIAVGEYGSNYHRPHYHIIFWNLPKMTDFSYDLNNAMVCSMLQDAWSKRISKKRYEKLTDVEKYVQLDKNGKPLYYERLGFVHVKRAHDNTAAYLTKYILKEQVIPEGMNKGFLLSSRRNGIGYDFAKEIEWFYKENPSCTELEVLNKFSGTIHTLGIPQYFKDIWNPTGSKYAAKKYRYYTEFRDVFLCMNDVLNFYPFKFQTYQYEDYFKTLAERINMEYPYLTPITYHVDRQRTMAVNRQYAVYDFDKDVDFWSEIKWQYVFDRYWDILHYCYEKLMYDIPSVSLHDEHLRLRALYKGAVSQKMMNQPQPSVSDRLYELRKELEELRIKDMY